MQITDYELNEKIHAIIINPYLSLEDFNNNCNLIKKYNIKNISTTLNFIKYLRSTFPNNELKINSLLSYPFADLPSNFIKEFISYIKDSGANGIEFVPDFLKLSRNNLDEFGEDLEEISKADLPIRIIINNKLLEEKKFITALNISLEIGINKFQIGDGFGSAINPTEINQISSIIPSKNSIKIVGRIKSLSQVIEILNEGFEGVGTSNFYEIFQELRPL